MARRRSNLMFTALLGVLAGSFLVAGTAAQVPENEFKRMVGIDSWSGEELKKLEKGDPVVRALPTTEKQELANLGVVKIKNALPPLSIQTFRDSFDQKSSKAMKVGGRFRTPPAMADLANLELDDNAIEQLRDCVVAKCSQNMSSAMILRFKNEIDWSSADARERATQLFREMLLAHVQAYAAGGDKALGTFDNGRKTIDLPQVHTSLTSDATLVNDLAPEFVQYLKQFPASTLEGVESGMHWSVLDFGLKPSITVSHVATYTQRQAGAEQYIVASKQIYASRYFDSSLTFTMLLRVATANGTDAYLVLLDRSRSDSLDGAIGKLARGMVQRKAAERIGELLDKAHIRLLSAGKPAVSLPENRPGWLTRLARSKALYVFLASAVVGAMLFTLWRWRRRRAILTPQSKVAT